MRGESVAVAPPPAAAWQGPARRAFDIALAAAGLIVLVVPMLVLAAAIRLDSPGPALFRQRRVGRDRRPFTLLKFRTMRVGVGDAPLRELIARELAGEDASTNGSWKLPPDDRVTRLGAVVRRTSLDELPQLLNVLAGRMSIVGPRPCLEWEADMFPPEYHSRFEVRPGLTGLWQVSGRSTMGTLEMLELDVRYVRTRTPRGDLAIIARTIPALLGRNGAR